MPLFQEWHLMNNIDDNISLIEKLLNNKNYYYLSNIDIDDLSERLNEYKKFKILIEIKDDKIIEKDLLYNNNLIQLKRKIKRQYNYINNIHIISIIITLIFFYSIIKFINLYDYQQ